MAIVQMKKVSLVILDSTRKTSLEQLRKAGVLHLEAVEGESQTLSSFRESAAETEKALSILDEVKDTKKKSASVSEMLEKDAAREKAKEIIALSDRKKSLFDIISQNKNEIARLEKWGSVDPAEFQALAEKGIFLYMYEIPSDKYSLIPEDCRTVLVNSADKISRFLYKSDAALEERPAGIPAEAYAVQLPECSTAQMEKNILDAEQEILSIDKKISEEKKFRGALLAYKKLLAADIEFENIYSGMNSEASNEQAASEGSKLAWLTGYVPVTSMKKFKNLCAENGWAFVASDPADDDPVPTMLKNNKLVELIYPLTSFLDVTPGYHEYDISGWFLLFFCIFFAMIFGDAGYGALVCLISFIMMAKGAKKGGSFSSVNVLVFLLGFCTMCWGVLTCTWFGIEPERLPKCLVDLSFAPISPAKVGTDASNTNQQIFCFILAIIQLSIAHIKGIFRCRKSLRFLGELGSLLELWGMYYVVMDMVVDAVKYPLGITEETLYFFGVGWLPVPYIALGLLFVGFVLNFIFSNYEGSIKDSILESLKNIISVLLGVVNVFSDIVSYIRLWAVALAGAAISSTVNTMAGPMLGKMIMVGFGVVLLCFGHGLNIILNLLSVIVHGVRLNTLEFSQHLGMTWSGIKYSPFHEEK
ncbi:V-type ATP synthase subunit I [Treponema sp.]|uniref:V-type ATP synthase subunit I n=1 Tax=Treponema sp. TaxID=166 RepID=UPI003F0B3085